VSYQSPHADETLRQGLTEYRAENPSLQEMRESSKTGAEFFRCHDVVHVVFGCSTSLLHEAEADAWTLFGTTVTFRQFLGFLKIEEHKDIMAKVGVLDSCVTFIRAVPLILKVLIRTRAMIKKWPWDNFEEYWEKPLADIRAEFNIQLLEGRLTCR